MTSTVSALHMIYVFQLEQALFLADYLPPDLYLLKVEENINQAGNILLSTHVTSRMTTLYPALGLNSTTSFLRTGKFVLYFLLNLPGNRSLWFELVLKLTLN